MNLPGRVARILVYALCFTGLIVSVMVRRSVISGYRDDIPVSFITEVKKHGKPVTAVEIKGKTFYAKEKFTVVPLSDTDFEGYVTRNVALSMKEGQKVNSLNGQSGKTGKIFFLSAEMDMMSGLYRVEVKFEEPVCCGNGKLLVETEVAEKRDIIEAPNDALETENEKFFVWKIIDGKASRKQVELSARSGYSSIVLNGLEAEDILIVSGQSQLEEGDSVRVVNSNFKGYQER